MIASDKIFRREKNTSSNFRSSIVHKWMEGDIDFM